MPRAEGQEQLLLKQGEPDKPQQLRRGPEERLGEVQQAGNNQTTVTGSGSVSV